MERITYRITLDAYKNGIQRTLQGFETADNMSRRIAINLTSGGDTYEMPYDHLVAMMYVTTPNSKEPSINECTIEDNTIIYDVLPIVEEGITEMQIKLIESRPNGAIKVFACPKFAVEVSESGTNDNGAEQGTAFTALERAVAQAKDVYDSRLVRIEITEDCTFRAHYADGTIYENDYLHEALYNGNALLSESWAKGGTGMRDDEETNNSKYFSNVSRSSSKDATIVEQRLREILEESQLQSAFTAFNVNFEDGELVYISSAYEFDVDESNGCLKYESDGVYDPDEMIEKAVDEYLDEKTKEIDQTFSEMEDEMDRRLDESEAEVEQIRKELDASVDLTTTTSKTLPNSHAGGLKVLNLYGKSEQEKTSGVQLLPLNEQTLSYDGLTLTVKGSNITIKGTPTKTEGYTSFTLGRINLKAGTYTHRTDNKVVGIGVSFHSVPALNFAMSETVTTKTHTLSSDVETTVVVNVDNTRGVVDYSGNWMLNEGTIALPWEAFTGGQASPNPEYHQPIVSAGEKLALGKNLAKSVKVNPDELRQYQIVLMVDADLKPSTAYTLSFVGTSGNEYATNEYLFTEGTRITTANGITTVTLTTPADIEETQYVSGSGWYILKNTTANNSTHVFTEVMLNEDTTALPYEPYTAGVKKAVDVGIQKKLIGKNQFNNTATDRTIVGATFTVNKDKSITVNGKTTSLAIFEMFDTLQAGTYIANGCPTGVGCTIEHRKNEAFGTVLGSDSGNGASIVLSEETLVCSYIRIPSGVSCNNLTFKPMIREASITDDTYEPYTEQTLTINRVLRGIEVTDSSLANYTDENGQMWCADYADVERKVWVQRIKEVSFDDATWTFNADYNIWTCGYSDEAIYQALVCESVPFNLIDLNDIEKLGTRINVPHNIWVRNGSTTESPKGKAQYILATPIETPMTDEEIIALHSLKSNNGVTHITSDNVPDAPMLVKYGTSEVGALSLENGNLHVVNEVQNKQLEAKTEELQLLMENCLTADDFEVSGDSLIFKFL